jgi:hypothetical protein
MTKSAPSAASAATVVREVRPFLFLDPAPAPVHVTIAPATRERLERIAVAEIPQLVRSIVDYTIALQNRRALERGNPQPISLAVLNRRRRAARSWLLAILSGATDAATLHTVTARRLVEFVRGALAACLYDEAADNLLPQAKAQHVVETTLSCHLAAILRASAVTTTTN